jgi:DNA transposition AAA+ family ATPase
MVTDTQTPTLPAAQAAGEPSGVRGDTIRASWNISADELRKAISHASEHAQDLLVWCFGWCIDDAHPVSLAEFAEKVGVDKTTIGRIIRGTYTHPERGTRLPISENLIRAMELFRKMEQERARATDTGFVLTPTAKRIFTACDLARESQSPVFLIGPSHIGKTKALLAYTQENNHGHTVYVRLQAASGLGGMVRRIAGSLGISDKANTADLIGRIKRALRANMLLILDEVHELMHTYRKESFFACLEVIREFYDETNCGLVLCGTKLLFKRIDENRGELEQLLRRGVHKVVLADQPTKGDISAILAVVGLELPEKGYVVTVRHGGQTVPERPYELLKQLGHEEGLKSICERLRYGQKFATKAGEKLAWEYVVRAHLTIKKNALPDNDWE